MDRTSGGKDESYDLQMRVADQDEEYYSDERDDNDEDEDVSFRNAKMYDIANISNLCF